MTGHEFNTYGLPGSVPDGVEATWGGRAIDHGRWADLPHDRHSADGPTSARRRLLVDLDRAMPIAKLIDLACERLPRGDDVHPLWEGEGITVVGRRTGGYIYLQAWPTPATPDAPEG